MSDFDAFDETDLLRLDLADIGFATLADPADLGFPLRPASSFFTSTGDSSPVGADESPLATVTPLAAETLTSAAPGRRTRRPESGPHGTARTSAGRRWAIAAAGVAAVAAVTTAVVVLPQQFSTPDPVAGGSTNPSRTSTPLPAVPTYTDVAQVIQAAATGAGASKEETDELEYWRIDSRVQEGDGTPMTRKVWLGRSHEGLLLEDAEQIPLDPPTFGILTTEWSWDDLQELTSDPKELRALFMDEIRSLQSGPASKHDWTLVNILGNLLSEAPVPPQVRKAMWEVLIHVPSIELVGHQRDALGRDGQALSLAGPNGETYVWIVDVSSGTLLEISNMTEDPSDLVMRTTYIQRGPTDRIPMMS